MSAQWSPQHQQAQQYQHAPQYQQHPQYQAPQQYQQSQPQQSHHYSVQQPQNQQSHQYPVQNPQFPIQQYQQPPQLYSQPQPYQQHGQYIEGHQYPQAEQYPQAPPSTQQPQHYPQTQQQGYSGYQQQHPQYHSQQYSPQQQSTPQHVSYQQPNQQQASPTSLQTPTPVIPNSCFNCGAPNHYAQECPEPKRAVPAGALDPRKFSNPLKRPKPRTKGVSQSLPPPSAGVQAQGYPQSYPPSTYSPNGYPEHQAQYSPATPTSAQSPAQHQAWQQYWQWQAYQQQQQQHQQQQQQQAQQQAQQHAQQHAHQHVQQQAQQQAPPYAQQHYAVPVNQAVGYNDHYQQSSQAYLHAIQYDPNSQLYRTQLPQTQSTQTLTATATSAHFQLQPPSNTTEGTGTPQRQPSGSSFPVQSQSTLTTPSKQEAVTQDLEEVDLDSLDIPDLPKAALHNGENIHLPNTIVSPPVSLIGMPLPANFVVADALYPIPPPASEAEGRCQSKYLRDITSDILCENIKVSKYWKEHQNDTAFFDRPNDDNIVPVDEIRAQLKERYTNGEANDDLTRQTRSESRSSIALRKDSVDTRTRLEELEIEKAETLAKIAAKERERALKRGGQVSPPPSAAGGTPNDGQPMFKEEQVTPTLSAVSEKAVTYEQNTEDVLAALGVTGAPKPVTATNGAYNGSTHDQPNGAMVGPIRRYSGLESSGTMPYSPNFGPPPPPPPPTWQASFQNGVDASSYSAVPGSVNDHPFGTNGAETGNGYYNNGADGEVLSPNEDSYDQLSIRKRSYNRRDSSSSEEDTPAKRQEDDVTPKLKRRQPKVAAAYR